MTLALLLPAADGPVAWLRGEGGRGQTGGATAAGGLLDHPANLASLSLEGVARVVAIVPGTEVVLHRATLPRGGEEKARAAAAFVLEDELAVEVERVHAAIGPAGPDGSHPVAIVGREPMRRWRDWLSPLARRPVVLVPDYLALPVEPGRALLLDRGDHLALAGDGGGAGLDANLAPVLLPSLLAETASVTVASDRAERLAPPQGWGDRQVQTVRPLSDTDLLRAGLAAVASLNLLQGPFGLRAPGGGLTVWRRAAVLAGLVLALHLGGVAVTAAKLQADAAALEAEAEATFRRTFPAVTRVVNLRAQARREAASLSTDMDGDRFQQLTGALYAGLRDLPGIVVVGLRYDRAEPTLAVELAYADYGDIDRLRTALAGFDAGLTEGTSRQDGGRTVANATVTLQRGTAP